MSDLTLTEADNARRLALKYGGMLQYVRTWKTWLTWDGKRWLRDELGIAHAAAKTLASDFMTEAESTAAEAARAAERDQEELRDRTEAIIKWSRQCCRRVIIDATVALAETEAELWATADQFDRDSLLLTCENGTIDLRGDAPVLRPHDAADYITRLCPVAYDPAAASPTWDAFLARVLPDPDVRNWLQRWAGYCLTGQVSDQSIVFLHGSGQNGKSTFLNAIKYVLGEYAIQGAPTLIMAPEHGGGEDLARRQRANLVGRRLVLVQETEAGRYLAEAGIKQMTGGDAVTGAKLYENEREFQPTWKIAVATNYKPTVRGADDGIWRRMRLVPFIVRIPDEEKDPTLPDRLTAEAAGILRWMVDGYVAYKRDGLAPPASMRAATAEYRKDEDRLGEFLEDCTEVKSDGEAPSGLLYSRYKIWCVSRGEKPWTQRALTSAMTERGHKLVQVGKKKVRTLTGLRLKTESLAVPASVN